jgi:hypothetical protein
MTSFHKGVLLGLIVGAGAYHLYVSQQGGGG